MEQNKTSESDTSLVPVSEIKRVTLTSQTKPVFSTLVRGAIDYIFLVSTVTNGIYATLQDTWRTIADREKHINNKTFNTRLKSIEFNSENNAEAHLSNNQKTRLVKKSFKKKTGTGTEARHSEPEASSSASASISGKTCAFSESRASVDNALDVLLDEILKLQQTVEADRKTAVERKRKLDSIIEATNSLYQSAQRDMRDDGKLIWKIKDVSKRKERESKDQNYKGLFSERFQTPEGYQFRMRVFLDGAGQGKGTHISVFIQLCRTDYDDVLVYPFQGHCSITLFDQNTNPVRSKKEHYTVKFKSNNSSCFQKPVDEYNHENGVAQFVSKDFVHQHESEDAFGASKPVYIVRDVIFIGVEIKHSVHKVEKLLSFT